MTDDLSKQELSERLILIEAMLAEGRKSIESWGWSFILWGIAYYAAIAWSYWTKSPYAWPVTMVSAGLITAFLAKRQSSHEPETTMGRAIGSLWIAVAVSLFIFCLCGSIAGRLDQQAFIAAVGAMLGIANAASGLILRWKAQFAAAVVWWACATAAPFCSVGQSQVVFLVTLFLCQIVLGSYMMICEARERRGLERNSGAAHV